MSHDSSPPETHAQSQEEKTPCIPWRKSLNLFARVGQRSPPVWPALFVYSGGHHLDLFLIVDAGLKYAFVTVGGGWSHFFKQVGGKQVDRPVRFVW